MSLKPQEVTKPPSIYGHLITNIPQSMRLLIIIAFLTADIFASFEVLSLLGLRAHTLQYATFYTCSYLYTGNFTNVLIVQNVFTSTDSTTKMWYINSQM